MLLSRAPKNRPKKKQNRRRRGQARRVSLAAPTLDQVQRAVFEMPGRARVAPAANPYLDCRMNQFRAQGGYGIPDGRNADYLVIDAFAANSFECVTGAGFAIRTLPILPCTAIVSGLGASGTNDVNVDGVVYLNGSAGGAWMPAAIPQQWFPTYDGAPGSVVPDPYASGHIRLVAATRRLILTSPSVTASGVISVSPAAISATLGAITTDNTSGLVAGTLSVSYRNAAATTVAYTVERDVPVLSLDAPNFPTAALFNRDTVVTRVENGVYVVQKHRGDTFELNPTRDNPVAVVMNVSTAAPTAGRNITGVSTVRLTGATNGGGAIWWDDTWQQYDFVVSGVQPGQTFRFETALCFEVNPHSNSALAVLTKRKSIKNSPLLSMVDDMVNSMPTALPHSDPDRSRQPLPQRSRRS